VHTFALPHDGDVRLARWLHPGESPKVVTQRSVDAFRRFLKPGDVAIDIGAHTGDSTMPMALAVGTRGTVFALEPNPYVFKVLERNAALNPDKTHIVPLMFAAMPRDGSFEFEYSDSGYCNGGFHRSISRWTHGHFIKLRVEGRNIAAYLSRHAPDDLSRLRFIKIDAEGFDRAVTAALADTLKARRPYLKAEVYKHLPEADRRGFYHDLRSLGYRVFKCADVDDVDAVSAAATPDYRGPELGPDDLGRWKHFDLFAVPEELVEA